MTGTQQKIFSAAAYVEADEEKIASAIETEVQAPPIKVRMRRPKPREIDRLLAVQNPGPNFCTGVNDEDEEEIEEATGSRKRRLRRLHKKQSGSVGTNSGAVQAPALYDSSGLLVGISSAIVKNFYFYDFWL